MKIYQSFVLSLIVGTAMTAPAVAAASSGATTLDTTAVTAPAGVPESAMPQGTIKYYVTDTHEYEIAYGGSDYSQMYLHSTCVVYGADGKVYIKGVDRYDMQNQCFVEGRLEGNKIIVPLPQKYYDDGECFKKHLTLLEKETYYGNDEGEYLEVDDEDNNIVYVIDEDGNISLDLNDPQATGRPQYLVAEVMSYYDDDETDIGVGRGVQRLTLQPDLTHIRPNTVPAGVEMREYLLTSKDGDGGERASRVSFGIDGDKAYLVSYDWYDIENIAVGHVAGDKIVFSCPQFAAFDELSLFTAEDPATDADLDEVVFDYDPESGVCSCAGEATMCLYSLVWGAYLSSVSNPMMYPVDADFLNASPQDPTVIDFRHYDGRFGSIYWDVPDTTVKNHSFAGERMYVNIYKNGEILTIKNYEGEEYTDIYYGFDAPRFEFRPPSLYMEFHSDDYTTFGLQSFYVGSDGVTYASHLVTYDPYTDQYVGIRSADIDRSLVRAGYYDMTGRPIANPVAGGLYILRCTYTDGSTTTAKVVY